MRRLLLAVLVLAFAAQPASAGVQIVPTHMHGSAVCDVSVWSWTACGHIQNETKVITAPGVVGSGAFTYLTATGNGCADLFDVSSTIPGDSTRTVQVGGSFSTTCSNGTFFYELDAQERFPGRPVLGAIHIGKRIDPNDSSKNQELNECVRQPFVWCELTRVYDTGRDTQADFRFSTRPLLVQIVNNTPNPIRRLSKGITSRGVLLASVGDTASSVAGIGGTPPGGTAWLGGLRRTGDASCPIDPATSRYEADCVATKLQVSSIGGVYRILPATGPVTSDYAGGEIAFTVRVRTDGVQRYTCTPLYRPTLPPLTCTVEFGGSNDGVLTATVTIKASGA